MIADSQTGTRFSSSVGYITEEGRATEVKTRNVFHKEDPKQAAREMQITADLRERVEKPVYSISIGYHPDEEVTDEEMLEDMEEFLGRRGLGEHQAVLATHRDKPHPHVHATVNRVNPRTKELWRDSFDRLKNMETLRELEQERGRISPEDVTGEEEREQRGRIADWKLRRFERTGEVPFGQEVQAQAGDVFAEAETWKELQTELATQGLHVERKGSGGIVTDGEEAAPLSEVARAWSFGKLEDRFPDEYRPHETYERGAERAAGPSGRGDRSAPAAGRRRAGNRRESGEDPRRDRASERPDGEAQGRAGDAEDAGQRRSERAGRHRAPDRRVPDDRAASGPDDAGKEGRPADDQVGRGGSGEDEEGGPRTEVVDPSGGDRDDAGGDSDRGPAPLDYDDAEPLRASAELPPLFGGDREGRGRGGALPGDRGDDRGGTGGVPPADAGRDEPGRQPSGEEVSEDPEGDSPAEGSSGDLSRSQKKIKELVEAIDAAGDGEDVSREIDDLDYQLSITGETKIEELRESITDKQREILDKVKQERDRGFGRGR